MSNTTSPLLIDDTFPFTISFSKTEVKVASYSARYFTFSSSVYGDASPFPSSQSKSSCGVLNWSAFFSTNSSNAILSTLVSSVVSTVTSLTSSSEVSFRFLSSDIFES